MAFHGQAVTLAQQWGETDLLIGGLTALGAAEYQEGQREDAGRRYQQALELLQQRPDVTAEAVLRNNLGLVRQAAGDVGQAEQLFREALALNQASGSLEAEASNHVNLGILAEERHEYDVAEREFERALELDKAAEHRVDIAADLLRLSRIADRRGFPDRALAYSERAYRSYLAQGNRPQAVAALAVAVGFAKKLERVQEIARLEKELGDLTPSHSSR